MAAIWVPVKVRDKSGEEDAGASLLGGLFISCMQGGYKSHPGGGYKPMDFPINLRSSLCEPYRKRESLKVEFWPRGVDKSTAGRLDGLLQARVFQTGQETTCQVFTLSTLDRKLAANMMHIKPQPQWRIQEKDLA